MVGLNRYASVMFRFLASLPVGLIVMFVVVAVVEMLGHEVFPPSDEMKRAIDLLMKNDPGAQQAIRDALPTMSNATFVPVVLAWMLGAGAGAWTSAAMAGRMHSTFGLAIGLLVALFAAGNMLAIPHPTWMWPAGILLPVASAMVMARAARRDGPAASQPVVS